MRKKTTPFLSRISVRLLGFNILLVFLPIAGFLYLNTYEKQLLKALENSLVQQGRMLSASLSGQDELNKEEAVNILKALKHRHEARLRVVDKAGRLLADSSRLSFVEPDVSVYPEQAPEAVETRQSFLYRIASFPVKLYRRFLKPPEPPFESGEFYSNTDTLMGSEIQAALGGRYGSVTRISSGGQRSVTLYSAIPIRSGENFGDNVIGAALVSQSTYRILRDLYLLRLDVFKVFLICVAAAAALSLLVSMTIAYPVRYLSRQAEKILDRSGRLKGRFHDFKRRDEIGDLSRALKELTLRMEGYMDFVESFASDVTHELKNPLASIRSATEMAMDVKEPDEQARFLSMIQQDVSRMGHLLSGIREISIIDAQMEQEQRPRIHINAFVEKILEGYSKRNVCGIQFRGKICIESLYVAASRERFVQVLENILDNAVSFSKKSGLIEINLHRDGEYVEISICDNGPGIPDKNLEKIFDRFFCYRPCIAAENKEDHTGLGLSIAKAIVESYGGSIAARNRKTGGTCFVIKLPLVE